MHSPSTLSLWYLVQRQRKKKQYIALLASVLIYYWTWKTQVWSPEGLEHQFKFKFKCGKHDIYFDISILEHLLCSCIVLAVDGSSPLKTSEQDVITVILFWSENKRNVLDSNWTEERYYDYLLSHLNRNGRFIQPKIKWKWKLKMTRTACSPCVYSFLRIATEKLTRNTVLNINKRIL